MGIARNKYSLFCCLFKYLRLILWFLNCEQRVGTARNNCIFICSSLNYEQWVGTARKLISIADPDLHGSVLKKASRIRTILEGCWSWGFWVESKVILTLIVFRFFLVEVRGRGQEAVGRRGRVVVGGRGRGGERRGWI